MHIDKNATLVNIPHEDCNLEESKKYVDTMQAMIDGTFRKSTTSSQKASIGITMIHTKNEFYDWFMTRENDLYPVAAWFYDQGFTEAIDNPEVFKQLDL